jgi:hypothetical protein
MKYSCSTATIWSTPVPLQQYEVLLFHCNNMKYFCSTATIWSTPVPLQQWLRHLAAMLRYSYIACLELRRTIILRIYKTLGKRDRDSSVSLVTRPWPEQPTNRDSIPCVRKIFLLSTESTPVVETISSEHSGWSDWNVKLTTPSVGGIKMNVVITSLYCRQVWSVWANSCHQGLPLNWWPSRLQRGGVFLSAVALATARVFRVTIKGTAVCMGSSGREGRT